MKGRSSEVLRENYKKLRLAGFSIPDAARMKSWSKAKIEDAIASRNTKTLWPRLTSFVDKGVIITIERKGNDGSIH